MNTDFGCEETLDQIDSVNLTQSFVDEGGIQPAQICREITKQVYSSLNRLQLMPKRIGASLVGGIMLVYRFPDQRVLEVETENELSISCVVSNAKNVTHSEVFDSVEDATTFIKTIL